MSNSVSLSFTQADGSVVAVSGTLSDASYTVTPPPTVVPPVNPEPAIPATAVSVDMLPVAWKMNHDAGTPGSATGTTTFPVAAQDGTANCRIFNFTLVAKGGFIYHANAMANSSAYNTFCYETEEYFPDASNLQCMEKDMEQVAADGSYVDMATQLDGNHGCLDYTENQKWVNTAVKANPTAIQPGWYITKRYFKNLGAGMVEYIGSNDGGVYSPLNITVKSQPSAKWGPNILNVQYQFDGKSSGSVASVVYVRKFNIHCWKS